MRRSAYLVSDLGPILRLPIPRCPPSMANAGRKVGLGSRNRRWRLHPCDGPFGGGFRRTEQAADDRPGDHLFRLIQLAILYFVILLIFLKHQESGTGAGLLAGP